MNRVSASFAASYVAANNANPVPNATTRPSPRMPPARSAARRRRLRPETPRTTRPKWCAGTGDVRCEGDEEPDGQERARPPTRGRGSTAGSSAGRSRSRSTPSQPVGRGHRPERRRSPGPPPRPRAATSRPDLRHRGEGASRSARRCSLTSRPIERRAGTYSAMAVTTRPTVADSDRGPDEFGGRRREHGVGAEDDRRREQAEHDTGGRSDARDRE